ncbi:hypothetical protein [Streptomyces sp. SID12488]|nr:hypothetical protein [Streptomyces sp. SID12488]
MLVVASERAGEPVVWVWGGVPPIRGRYDATTGMPDNSWPLTVP